MTTSNNYTPIYTLGGPGFPGFPAIPGTGIGPGYAVSIRYATVPAAMFIKQIGGTSATVFLEANGGPLDSAGNPPSTDWVDVTGGTGYALTPSTVFAKVLPASFPFWRCRISAINGGAVVAYVPNGNGVNAAYPSLQATQSLF